MGIEETVRTFFGYVIIAVIIALVVIDFFDNSFSITTMRLWLLVVLVIGLLDVAGSRIIEVLKEK